MRGVGKGWETFHYDFYHSVVTHRKCPVNRKVCCITFVHCFGDLVIYKHHDLNDIVESLTLTKAIFI